MEYKIVSSTSAHDLNKKINEMIVDGWNPKGSHHVVVERVQNQYAGSQFMRSLSTMIYTQTMIKN